MVFDGAKDKFNALIRKDTIKPQVGFTDKPAEHDEFEITNYTKGLARFIEECNTPMTISIQGSWGTGKTSIMNLVQEQLKKKDIVFPVFFNTWQFSQFNMSEQLPVSLLSGLTSSFGIEDKQTLFSMENALKALRPIYQIGKGISLAALSWCAPGVLADAAKNTLDGAEKMANKAIDNSNASNADPAKAIIELKGKFETCVQKTLEEKNKKRIVIFIDDLDRLNPGKAVELLEVLKLFLDCENCVYVLAIDYDVVCRGVEAKYGSLADDNEKAQEKGKSFFDKIIQVPFKMPIAKYNISRYVKTHLGKIGIDLPDEKDANVYVDLIRQSIGTNPRAMKRLFNAFQLLLKVVPSELITDAKDRQLLFAVLCLQYCNETIYNIIIRNSEIMEFEMFEALLSGNYDSFSDKATAAEADIDDLSKEDFESVTPFLKKLKEALDLNNSGGIDEDEFKKFKELLDWTSITKATDDDTSKASGRGSHSIDFSELRFSNNTEDDINHIRSVIKLIGDNIYTEALRANSGAYDFIRGRINGNNFIEVEGRKNGYAIYLIAPDKTIFDNEPNNSEIIQCVNKLGATFRNSKCVTKTVYQGETMEEDENQIIKLGQLLYRAWLDKA